MPRDWGRHPAQFNQRVGDDTQIEKQLVTEIVEDRQIPLQRILVVGVVPREFESQRLNQAPAIRNRDRLSGQMSGGWRNLRGIDGWKNHNRSSPTRTLPDHAGLFFWRHRFCRSLRNYTLSSWAFLPDVLILGRTRSLAQISRWLAGLSRLKIRWRRSLCLYRATQQEGADNGQTKGTQVGHFKSPRKHSVQRYC